MLPSDTGWPELERAMIDNLNGLGLPRTGGEGCLFCHVGTVGTDMETWDFASDEKREKQLARVMMRMVREVNEEYLATLQPADSVPDEVTCNSCHRGRTNPRSLPAILARSYASGGVGEVEREYRRLRDELFGRGVYDFRGALVGFAVELADQGSYDDAIRMVRIELDVEPASVNAHRWLIRLAVERAISQGRRAGLAAVVDSVAAESSPDGALVWFTLRAVGVRLQRAGRLEAARGAFTLNADLFGQDHRVVTDLARAHLQLGDTATAAEHARRALEIAPDYANAAQLLSEIGRER